MNLALKTFIDSFETETILGQVVIRRAESGFQLRHAADAGSRLRKTSNLSDVDS